MANFPTNITDEMVEQMQRDIDKKLSQGIEAAYRYKGLTQQSLAKMAGVPQSSINAIYLKTELSSGKARHWTFPLLIKIAYALGVDPCDLIGASLTSGDSAVTMVIRSAISDTEPRSSSRLQNIIYAVRQVNTRRKIDKVGEPSSQLSYQYAEMGCPEFCKDFYEGRVSDSEASIIIAKTLSEIDPATSKPYPFALALGRVYKKK